MARAGRRPRRDRAEIGLAQLPYMRLRNPFPPFEIVSADQVEAIHRASLRVLAEIGMNFLLDEARAILAAAGAEVERSAAAGALRSRLHRGADPHRADRLHAACAQSRTQRHDRRGRINFAVVASAPQRLRPRARPAHRQLRRLLQPDQARPQPQHLPPDRAAIRSSRSTCRPRPATSTRSRRWPPTRIAISTAMRSARCGSAMRSRSRASPAGDLRGQLLREPSMTTVVNANSPLQYDGPMLEGVIEMARHNQPVIFTPFTLAGAMAPITVAGALVQQNAEALAGIAFAPVRPSGLPGGLRQLHLERRHEQRRARLRHAGVRQGDARERPARAPLPPAVPRLQRQRLERARRPVGLRVRDVDLALRAGALQRRQARPRLARGRAVHVLREDHPRRRDAADDRGVARAARDRATTRSASRRSARSARAAISSRRPTRWRATSARSTRRCSPTGAISRPGRRAARSMPRSAPTASGRSCSPPTSRRPWTRAIAEELAAFVARRKEEGGAPTT